MEAHEEKRINEMARQQTAMELFAKIARPHALKMANIKISRIQSQMRALGKMPKKSMNDGARKNLESIYNEQLKKWKGIAQRLSGEIESSNRTLNEMPVTYQELNLENTTA